MSRYNGHRVFVNNNVDEIFNSVVEWEKTYTKVPDQQDPVYTMVDIACNTDLVLMQKHMPEPLIDYLKKYDDHPRLNSTMATKYPSLLKLDVNHFNKKPRVRISVMPQKYSNILEPKMQPIEDRLREGARLRKLGWEVHINFSPIIFYPKGSLLYDELFKMAKDILGETPCEIIALTNHDLQMAKASPEAQELMKYSSEVKNSSGVKRYPIKAKRKSLDKLVNIYCQYFKRSSIRYIF